MSCLFCDVHTVIETMVLKNARSWLFPYREQANEVQYTSLIIKKRRESERW